MAKRGPDRKQRTREHVLADLAFNHVERHVLLAGHTMHRIVHDYGLDAAIRTFSPEGYIESGLIWLQLKASDSVRPLARTGEIAARVARRDLNSWLSERYPVVLVVYDGVHDRAYWHHVQSEIGGGRIFSLPRDGSTVTIRIDPTRELNRETSGHWRDLRIHEVERWWEG